MHKLKPAQIVGHLQQLADMAGRLSDKIGIGQTRKPELERQMRVQRVAMDQRYFRQTKNPDPLGRLSEDSKDDDIAIHYRITLQTLQKHLPILRITKPFGTRSIFHSAPASENATQQELWPEARRPQTSQRFWPMRDTELFSQGRISLKNSFLIEC